ncbi:galanin receptor 2b-like [Acropora palmata]|uniref:galanin receptor 2b-like n=1 Tax=Acropora palmata TaxID=6131 RepID=UPI003DA0B0AE
MNITGEMNGTLDHQNTTILFDMDFSLLLVWCIAFGVVAIIVIVMNILVLLVFSSNRSLFEKRHNQFLIVLALTDIIVGTVVIPLYIYQLISWWLNGLQVLRDIVFEAFNAMDILSGFASIFTLAMIAADRVYAILFPFYHRVPPKGVYPSMLASVWVFSGLLVVYYFLSSNNILPIRAFTYLFLLSITISLLVICISYTLVWSRVKCFKLAHMTRGASLREKRIAEMLFMITIVFIFTWLPFHVLNFLFHFCKFRSSCYPSSVSIVYLSKLLHYSNTFLNPLVYSFKSSEFRMRLKRIIGRGVSRPNPELHEMTGNRTSGKLLLLERQDVFRRVLVKESKV